MHDNSLSMRWHALAKDTPGKAWWRGKGMHAAIFRALRIDRDQDGAIYAAQPFRLATIDDRHVILAAYPAPRLFDDPECDWLGIEQVIAWNPIDDSATIMGDTEPQLAGCLSDDANALFASPRAFFKQWAARRAAFAIQRQKAASAKWHIAPREGDECPGSLIVGDPARIKWNPSAMPSKLECIGVDPKTINRAILRAARLPFATTRGMRAAA